MKEILKSDIIEQAREIANRGNVPLQKIEDRCDYIMNFIFDIYQFSTNWWFPDSDEGEYGGVVKGKK